MRRRTDHVFRRNLIVAGVCHLALIVVVLLFEGGHLGGPSPDSVTVELFTPADLLGDMPKGAGYGRGAYAPAAGGGGPAASETMAHLGTPPAPVPTSAPVAPRPTPAAAAPEPGEVYVPKAEPAKPAVKPAPKPPSTATRPTTNRTATATARSATTPRTTIATPSRPAATGAGSGTAASGPSATDIRNRFASALKAVDGGTPYGDGRAAGGGEGRSAVIGSRDGSPDGIVGGVGRGSPHWDYYQHVHDRMYEAWDQPGAAVNWDKSLVATIKLVVARDGSVLATELVKRSGNPIMDDSALTAARKVPRLRPLPEGLGGATAPITVNFRLEG